jgi:hypothetical protein
VCAQPWYLIPFSLVLWPWELRCYDLIPKVTPSPSKSRRTDEVAEPQVAVVEVVADDSPTTNTPEKSSAAAGKRQEPTTGKKLPAPKKSRKEADSSAAQAQLEKKTTEDQLAEELDTLFDLDAEPSRPDADNAKDENKADDDNEAQPEDAGEECEDEGDEEKEDDPPVSELSEKGQKITEFACGKGSAELFVHDAELYLKGKNIKTKTVKKDILFSQDGGKFERVPADKEPDFVWDIKKSTKVMYKGKPVSVGDILKLEKIAAVYGYNYVAKGNKLTPCQDEDGEVP